MAERDEFGAFLLGFIVGGLTGAVASLLLAPQSGENTRTLIKEKAIVLGGQMETSIEEARTHADAIMADARTRAEAITAEAKVRADEVMKQARTGVEDLQKRGQVVLEEQRTRFAEVASKMPPNGSSTGEEHAES
jgi:gas vesicle protein